MPTRPAMVLVEALVAAAIIAVVAGCFLSVMVQGGGDLARSRQGSAGLAVGEQALAQAKAEWPKPVTIGDQAGFHWDMTCAKPALESPRLQLIRCKVVVRRRLGLGSPPITLESAWAAPRPPPSPP